jgi:hypothetical protein
MRARKDYYEHTGEADIKTQAEANRLWLLTYVYACS